MWHSGEWRKNGGEVATLPWLITISKFLRLYVYLPIIPTPLSLSTDNPKRGPQQKNGRHQNPHVPFTLRNPPPPSPRPTSNPN